MRRWARAVALTALAATIGPPVLLMLGILGEGSMRAIMLVGAVGWFVSAPFWLRED